jgi:ferritin-like metal-binding protein YciE
MVVTQGDPSTKEKPMTITTLEDLLLDQIHDLYDAEKQLVRALPKMAKAATSDDLKETITQHLEETKNQVSRLEEVFNELEAPIKGKSCKAMKGLIEEGGEAAAENGGDALIDLSIIAAAQRVEHYEISAYGTARAIARHLGHEKIASLLEETEEEEKAADTKLTEIAGALYDQAGSQNGSGGEHGRRPASKASGDAAPARRAQHG